MPHVATDSHSGRSPAHCQQGSLQNDVTEGQEGSVVPSFMLRRVQGMRVGCAQAPAAPPGDQALNYYPFLDFAWCNCTVSVTLGPTHWSHYETVQHGMLELVCTSHHTGRTALCMPLRPLLKI